MYIYTHIHTYIYNIHSIFVMTMLRSDDKMNGFVWIHRLVTAQDGRLFFHGWTVHGIRCLEFELYPSLTGKLSATHTVYW